MFKFLLLSTTLLALCKAEVLGSGSSALVGLFQNWFYAYSSLRPDVQIRYNYTSPQLGISSIINGTPFADFTFIESLRPSLNDAKINSNFQMFPFLASALYQQVNIPAIQNTPYPLILDRPTLANIYMGVVTNWRDPSILATNPNLNSSLPNANITVIWRSDAGGANSLMSAILSSASPLWKSKYGTSSSWPTALRTLPNFIPANVVLYHNAKVLAFPNSIGYVSPNMVTRDSQIQAACLINIMGSVICPNTTAIAAAVSTSNLSQVYLTNNLTAQTYAVDGMRADAYPMASLFTMLVPKHPSPDRCPETREFYKFIRWTFTDSKSREQSAQAGFAPLASDTVSQVLNVLSQIQCAGHSVLEMENVNERDVSSYLLLAGASVVLVFVLILSAFHLYSFRTYINLVYTLIFVVGAIITLISPFFWYKIPSATSICQARVWTTTVGLSILLGTIFSRTWQLRDIYILQKKGEMAGLKENISLRKSLIKLAGTLGVVICWNFLIMTIWTAVDPYRAVFQIVDDVNLQGRWTCTSSSLGSWLLVEMLFLLALIIFGVYVIYYTWSFQRQALISETRWVLIALYNVILNLTAVTPIEAIIDANDDTLALVMMASIIFSGGGIVMAFLLPRSLDKLFGAGSKKGSNTHTGDAQLTSVGAQKGLKLDTHKEISRTPGEELSQRLECPQPNYRNFSNSHSEAPSCISKHHEAELLGKKSLSQVGESVNGTALDHAIHEEEEHFTHGPSGGKHGDMESLETKSLAQVVEGVRGTLLDTEEDDLMHSLTGIKRLEDEHLSSSMSGVERFYTHHQPLESPSALNWSPNPLTKSESIEDDHVLV